MTWKMWSGQWIKSCALLYDDGNDLKDGGKRRLKKEIIISYKFWVLSFGLKKHKEIVLGFGLKRL